MGLKPYPSFDNLGYIYDRPQTREQYYTQSFLSGASRIMAGLYSARDNTAYMDDYLRNRGMTYADIKYPVRTAGFGAYSGLGSVSSSVLGLYL